MEIRILPSNIANMIAAGEVVQRPASVVKELVENAVDAGADQISVLTTDAGRTLIQVIDNGCGMSPDEAVLCFERHATSKIASAEDLMSIETFGFRGEALASIAAVAEVTLKTRRAEDEVGCKVEFADSRHLSTDMVSTPVGSNFSIRNLFYNIPARRKFLKSDNVELKHVVEEFVRIALTRPDIGFTLMHNGREIYVLKKAKSLKFRIQDLLGSNVVSQVVEMGVDTSIVNVHGYIGRPDQAKKTLGNQFFFVNGRYFKSAYLHKAVMNAYENMLPQGVTPSYFIYLETDPHSFDVNVSPTKTEVKFENDSVIFQTLFACVKETLGRNSFGVSMDFEAMASQQMPVFSGDFEKIRPDISQPGYVIDQNYNPFDTPSTVGGSQTGESSSGEGMSSDASGAIPAAGVFGGSMPDGNGGFSPSGAHVGFGQSGAPGAFQHQDNYGSFANPSHFVDKREDYGKLFEDKVAAQPSILVIGRKYIVSAVPSGLCLINVRRAQERILYERFLKALNGGEHVSQSALFPVQVVVGVDNRLIFDEHTDMLRSLGFDISPFGNDTIVVNGMPEGFQVDQNSVESAMADVLIALSEEHTSLPGIMESAMAEKFARMSSAGKQVDSPVAARSLMDALFACSNPEFTNSGRRIVKILSSEELDNLF